MRNSLLFLTTRPCFVISRLPLSLGLGTSISGLSWLIKQISSAEIRKMLNKQVRTLVETFIEIINSTFYDFKTHTSNNSTELTDYEEIAAITDGDFYFARSYRSNDRGLNKHNNDLIMRFLSKERDSNEVSN